MCLHPSDRDHGGMSNTRAGQGCEQAGSLAVRCDCLARILVFCEELSGPQKYPLTHQEIENPGEPHHHTHYLTT